MKKGFINVVEVIIVIIVLFVAFGVLFPGFTYRGKWGDALLLLKGRDLIVTMDRTGQLYDYSFNPENLQNFLDTIIPSNETGLLSWSETEGTIKTTIWIACNCSNEEMNEVLSWTKGFRINDRDIDFMLCYTNLDSINPCLATSDVLFIFGYQNISAVLNTLKAYLTTGSGIVEMADVTKEQLLRERPLNGTAEIFGLGLANSETFQQNEYTEYDLFPRKPENATDIIYGPWKYFYRVPVPVYAPLPASSVPSDGVVIRPCTTLTTGSFDIQANITANNTGETYKYQFWICDSQYIYIDTHEPNPDPTDPECLDGPKRITPCQIPNGKADVELQVGDEFQIINFYDADRNWNFYLNYIYDDRIHVSFRPDYEFHDFIKYDFGCAVVDHPGKPSGDGKHPGWCKGGKAWAGVNVLTPAEDDRYKILLQSNVKTKQEDEPVPAVLLNEALFSRVAWIANFTEEEVGHDEKLLLTSLFLWASNKRSVSTISPELRRGFKTSYVNTVNKDMFEVYKFNLGLGYPF